MISVLILTRNEQLDLPGALASVAWSDDIHVLDSCSTDDTAAIVHAAGAQLHTRTFDDWSTHQNWALANLPFRHPWVFYLDADERVSPALFAALQQAVAAPGNHVAFRVQRRDFLYGQWLRHVQITRYYLRLFRPDRIRYERLVNPVCLADGPTAQLTGYLDHYPFSKGLAHWIDRHNTYSTLEARQIGANRLSLPNSSFSLRSALFEPDPSLRRFHQKEIFYRLPCRPVVKFLLVYVIRRGILDGRAGFVYAVLQSFYEYFIVLKTAELTQTSTETADPAPAPNRRTPHHQPHHLTLPQTDKPPARFV